MELDNGNGNDNEAPYYDPGSDDEVVSVVHSSSMDLNVGSSDTEVDSDAEHGEEMEAERRQSIELTKSVNFDRTLPMQHNYLGEDLNVLQGRTLLDEGSIHWLPILPQQDVVLVPGQTLPLTVYYQPTIAMLQRALDSNRLFGAICLQQRVQGQLNSALADVGTTAEIYESQDPEDERSIRIKAIGRQRFKVLDVRGERDGYTSARLEILPEIILPDPMAEIRLHGCDRFRTPGLNKEANKSKRLNLRVRDSVTSVWPSWVFAQYEADRLVERMTRQLANLNLALNVPTDPVELSFWVARSLPVRDRTRLKLLRMNSAIERLQWELGVISKFTVLCCRFCDLRVGHQRDVFSMSAEGFQGAYCNEHGYVHETITIHKAKGLRLLGDLPSTEYSWFPGYAWTIAECSRCGKHMGWLFTSTNSELKPSRFWGLCRRSLTAKSKDDVQ